jgi:serine/threonine protein kinase
MDRVEIETVERLLAGLPSLEEIFGKKEEAKKNFHRLLSLTHEDRYDDSLKPRAHKLFLFIHEKWEEAERKMANGTYGDVTVSAPKIKPTEPVSFKTKKNVYTIIRRIHSGGTCGIFEAIVESNSLLTRAVIRVPHSVEDNDLMEKEANFFKLLKKKAKEIAVDKESGEAVKMFLSRFPWFLESVKLLEPGASDKKVVNIFGQIPNRETGWFTLSEIRKEYPEGVHPRIMTFIWNKVFEGLVFAHSSGITHNAITPNHILVHAESHLGNIIDWTASTVIGVGEKIPYIDSRFEEYFPDEVKNAKGEQSPSSDIYMSAWCMVYLLGGSPKEKYIPSSVPEPMRKFLNRCLQPTKSRRPRTAEIAYQEFQQIAKDLFGPKKFVELVMPRA